MIVLVCPRAQFEFSTAFSLGMDKYSLAQDKYSKYPVWDIGLIYSYSLDEFSQRFYYSALSLSISDTLITY